jgi:KDO2-lipid IV(A) lauroyltransferase
LDNPFLHRFITNFRGSTGQFMIPKKGSAKQIDHILGTGSNLVLLGDQYAGPKGSIVKFFHRPASCHKAVALFSLLNKAPMMLAHCTRRGAPMQFHVGVAAVYDPIADEPMGPQELTQWYSDQLESMIRRCPDQYWWLHRRWKMRATKKRRSPQRRVDAAQSGPPGKHARSDTNAEHQD